MNAYSIDTIKKPASQSEAGHSPFQMFQLKDEIKGTQAQATLKCQKCKAWSFWPYYISWDC